MKKARLFLKFTIIAAIFIVIGLLFSYFLQIKMSQDFAKEISWTADISLAAINPDRVKAIAGYEPENFSQAPDYSRIKEQILNLGRLFTIKGIDSIYILNKKGSEVYFIVESTPYGEPLYVAPGKRYDLVPPEASKAFIYNRPFATEKYQDEFGTYISIFSPILDFKTGEQVGVLGVDIDEVYYLGQLYKTFLFFWLAWLAVYALLVFVSLFLFNIYKLKNNSLVNEQKIRSISNAVIDGIVAVNDEDEVYFWSKASENIFKVTAENALGVKFTDLVKIERVLDLRSGSVVDDFKFSLSKNLADELLEFKFKRPGEKEFSYYELYFSVATIAGHDYLIGTFHDISRRRREQSILQKQTNDLEKLNNLMIDRELKMVEMKKELALLKDK